jgi:TolA-binding protein
LARKAALEIGMLHYNQNQYDEAIEAFKKVVADYPNSEETRTALETLEAIYVEQNKVEDYFAYTKTLGNGIVVTDATKEDSLTFIAAEKMFMKNDYAKATGSLERYLQNFGENGHYIISARYYLGECYYETNKMDDALVQYKALSTMLGNPYMESVLVRLSQISFDKQDYPTALASFKQLATVAEDKDNIKAAKIGILRCSYLTQDIETTINIANEILSNKAAEPALAREAKFYLVKSYLLNKEDDKALADLKVLSKDLKTPSGAECKYLLANYYFEHGDNKKAEDEVNDYIKKGTPHQYWLARAFVLLADIYIKQGDDFQAKQYLTSLQENYTNKDTIQDLIQERLDAITARENNTIAQ